MNGDDSFSMMTPKEIFELREQGRTEEAYEAARMLYRADKSNYAASAMFWTAVDMLRLRVGEGREEEAHKIFLALERLIKNLRDENGWKHNVLRQCKALLFQEDIKRNDADKGLEHLQMGNWGEELAAVYLREKGYAIMERDWHSKHRDIDIIAQNTDYYVFVEVKTRSSQPLVDPLLAIDFKKRQNLRLAIDHYIKYHKVDKPCRFDVITIVGEMGKPNPVITHIEDYDIL